MKVAFAIFLALHGLIHGMGFVKGFGLAKVPQLGQPISRPVAVLWLLAGIGFVAAAVLLLAARGRWWIAAGPALLLSQALIFINFRDARLGTIANAIVLVPLVIALLDLRPSSLPSRYGGEVKRQLEQRQSAPTQAPASVVTEGELVRLPAQVQKYLRRAGVVGKPRVRNLRASFRARFRTSPDSEWMDATGEQYDFLGPPGPARLFFMEASRFGIPVVAFHRYVGDDATMDVRVAGLVQVASARGPRATQSETVTLLNDMCMLAPAALLDAPITWQPLGEREVRATYSNAGKTVSAVLSFDEAGDLSGFVSHDRYQSDGKTERLLPWSTPFRDHRDFGAARLPAEGDARWQEPTGEWSYGKFTMLGIAYNVD